MTRQRAQGGRYLVSAFTLIEVVVVLLIVGILAAMVLPAIHSAREVARKTQCVANLRQLGVALSSYESSFGTLPGGGNGAGYSLHTMLLPFVEERPIYHALNFEILSNELSPMSPNLTMANYSVALFMCPSQSRPTSSGLPGTNYAGCFGTGLREGNAPGAFVVSETHGVRDLIDGASHTVGDVRVDRGTSDCGCKRRARIDLRCLVHGRWPGQLHLVLTRVPKRESRFGDCGR